MFFAAALVILGSCRENTLISSKIAPPGNAINTTDTSLPIITHTYYDDTAQTSTNLSGIPNYAAVGTITDPFFGTMTSSVYFQVIPWNTSDSFFYLNTIDSAVLVLPYSGFTYGDTGNLAATQTYQVFYMTDSLGYNSTYYSNNTKQIDATYPLSDPYTFNVHSLGDSISPNGNVINKNDPGLRIPLKLNVLLSHLKPAQMALANSTNVYGDFQNAFKGICVKAADTRLQGAAIPYFALDGIDFFSEAGVLLYYHQNGATRPSPDSSLFTNYYFSTAYCAHFTSIQKSYSHYPVNNLFNSTQANDSVIALQNLPGASIDVVIPGITKLPPGVINKAELQFPLLPGSYGASVPFQGPEKIYPSGVGNGRYPNSLINAGLTYVIADYYPISSTSPLIVLDGYVHQFPNGNWVYTVDIPREVLYSIKSGNDTLHLHMNGTQEFYGAFHMVGTGGSYSNTSLRPKLFVVYSKL